jgi:hypothetical protein
MWLTSQQIKGKGKKNTTLMQRWVEKRNLGWILGETEGNSNVSTSTLNINITNITIKRQGL